MAHIKIEHERGVEPELVTFARDQVLVASDGTKFELGSMIYGGEGGNGLVFRATRRGGMGVKCAIKILRRLDGQRIDRFHNEVEVLKQLNHEHICGYYGHGEIKTQKGEPAPWVAVDVGGENLRLHVDTRGCLPPRLVGLVGRQMCSALTHVHAKGLIHRDLKPANFVWTESPDQKRVLLIDFGLAKRVGVDTAGRPLDQFTQHNEFVGPVFYSSQELIDYAKDKSTLVDHRSDLFQLGRVLWFLATGTPGAGIPSKKRDPSGGLLYDLVMQLLLDEPDDRLSDLVVIDKALEAIAVET